MADPQPDRWSSLIGKATDDVLSRLRALAQFTGTAADSATRGSLTGGIATATAEVLDSLRDLVTQVPAPTASIDLFLEEIRAKRALVEAMQVQLTSFAAQLEHMERSLAPLQTWGRQWTSLQHGLAETLHVQRDPRGDTGEQQGGSPRAGR